MPGRQREKKIEGEKQCKIVSYQIEKKNKSGKREKKRQKKKKQKEIN